MRILFIGDPDFLTWAFQPEMEALEDYHQCFAVSNLELAKQFIETGLGRVVIYPFYLDFIGCKQNFKQDPQIFGGYEFWLKEIAPLDIPTIVVGFETFSKDDVNIQELTNTGWFSQPNVCFINVEKREKGTASERLLNLITS